MKKLQRIKQQATEALGRGEKSDKLTQKLAVVEKKVEGIRSAVQITAKKLTGTIQGGGSSVEKHQRKLPQYSLGAGMMEHGAQLGTHSLFGSVLMMVGQAQQDIASQMATYEITIGHDIITILNTMLEEDMKTVDKSKKRLSTARLDMDSVRSRLRNFEQQIEKSSREYNMEKLQALKVEVDEATRKFEESQDAYATSMYEFISKEQQYTDKIQQLVKLQITNYKNAAVQLEGMLPVFEKKMSETQDRPVFGLSLAEHLRISKHEIAAVLEVCCSELRKEWMDTEGLFRIAGGQAKVKFLKTALDAGQFDVSTHDPHTIAGCLKMYLRELPDPLLTSELYHEWMKATGVSNETTRLANLSVVLEKLPEVNLNNFRYLCCFLNEFSQYSDITKMSASNLSIVIGPNLLWPKEDSADAAFMVTQTALQSCLTEMFIEHLDVFFPDLHEATSTPSKSSSSTSPVTFTSPTPSSFSPTTLQSYTAKTSDLFSPPRGGAPPTLSSATSHRGEKELQIDKREKEANASPVVKPQNDLLHPLADAAIDEGVTVVLDESSSPKSYQRAASSPFLPDGVRSRSLPRSGPPVPAPRTSSTNNLTPPESPSLAHRNPPAPAPRMRHGTGPGGVRPASADTPTGAENGSEVEPNGQSEGGGADSYSSPVTPLPAVRPTPPARARRAQVPPILSTPPTPYKPPPYGSASPLANARAPARRAPPPPKAKKTASDELTSL